MTRTAPTETSKSRTAALMALYTFLLALGAAMPLAASYQPGLTAQAQEGGLSCGGYNRPVEIEQADEDEAADRPLAIRSELCVDADSATSVEAARGASDGATIDPSFRGS